MVLKEIGSVDLLRPKIELKYFILLILVIIMILIAWGLGTFFYGKLSSMIKAKAIAEEEI